MKGKALMFLWGLVAGMSLASACAPEVVEKRTVGIIDGRGQYHVLTSEE